MLMRLLTFRRVLRRRRIMPLKGLCKPPAQPVVMIFFGIIRFQEFCFREEPVPSSEEQA